MSKADSVNLRLVLTIDVTYVRTTFEIRMRHTLGVVLGSGKVEHTDLFALVTSTISEMLPCDLVDSLATPIAEKFGTPALLSLRESVLRQPFLQRSRSDTITLTAIIDVHADISEFSIC